MYRCRFNFASSDLIGIHTHTYSPYSDTCKRAHIRFEHLILNRPPCNYCMNFCSWQQRWSEGASETHLSKLFFHTEASEVEGVWWRREMPHLHRQMMSVNVLKCISVALTCKSRLWDKRASWGLFFRSLPQHTCTSLSRAWVGNARRAFQEQS